MEEAAKAVLKSKYYSTADQVENCIQAVQVRRWRLKIAGWDVCRENAARLLKEEMSQCGRSTSQFEETGWWTQVAASRQVLGETPQSKLDVDVDSE